MVLPKVRLASKPASLKVPTAIGRRAQSRGSKRKFYFRAVEWHREWFVFVGEGWR